MHDNGPIGNLVNVVSQFSYYEGHNFILGIARPNNCVVFTDGQIGLVDNIVKCENEEGATYHVVAKIFTQRGNLYQYPLESSLLGIHVVSGLTRQQATFDWADIKHKCVLLPHENEHVCFPFLHLAA